MFISDSFPNQTNGIKPVGSSDNPGVQKISSHSNGPCDQLFLKIQKHINCIDSSVLFAKHQNGCSLAKRLRQEAEERRNDFPLNAYLISSSNEKVPINAELFALEGIRALEWYRSGSLDRFECSLYSTQVLKLFSDWVMNRKEIKGSLEEMLFLMRLGTIHGDEELVRKSYQNLLRQLSSEIRMIQFHIEAGQSFNDVKKLCNACLHLYAFYLFSQTLPNIRESEKAPDALFEFVADLKVALSQDSYRDFVMWGYGFDKARFLEFGKICENFLQQVFVPFIWSDNVEHIVHCLQEQSLDGSLYRYIASFTSLRPRSVKDMEILASFFCFKAARSSRWTVDLSLIPSSSPSCFEKKLEQFPFVTIRSQSGSSSRTLVQEDDMEIDHDGDLTALTTRDLINDQIQLAMQAVGKKQIASLKKLIAQLCVLEADHSLQRKICSLVQDCFAVFSVDELFEKTNGKESLAMHVQNLMRAYKALDWKSLERSYFVKRYVKGKRLEEKPVRVNPLFLASIMPALCRQYQEQKDCFRDSYIPSALPSMNGQKRRKLRESVILFKCALQHQLAISRCIRSAGNVQRT